MHRLLLSRGSSQIVRLLLLLLLLLMVLMVLIAFGRVSSVFAAAAAAVVVVGVVAATVVILLAVEGWEVCRRGGCGSDGGVTVGRASSLMPCTVVSVAFARRTCANECCCRLGTHSALSSLAMRFCRS